MFLRHRNIVHPYFISLPRWNYTGNRHAEEGDGRKARNPINQICGFVYDLSEMTWEVA